MDEDERKALIRRTFDAVSEGYDRDPLRFFALSARAIPGFLGLRGDEHVLDLATGTGHAALALAERLPRGSVTAVDFSVGMLDRAREKCGARGLANVTFRAMDMQALDFPPASFDAAVCAFGLFFIEDMAAQLRLMASTVRPGGAVLITSFLDRPFPALSALFFERLRAFGVTIDPASLRRLFSPDECRNLFAAAGLREACVEERTVAYPLSGPDEWWEVVWSAGFRRFVSMLPAGEVERFRAEHLAEVASEADADGIRLEVNVLYTTGIVP